MANFTGVKSLSKQIMHVDEFNKRIHEYVTSSEPILYRINDTEKYFVYRMQDSHAACIVHITILDYEMIRVDRIDVCASELVKNHLLF